MIDFTRAQATHIIVHQVGNKSLGEAIHYSNEPMLFRDDFVKESLLRYFLTPFKTDIYYHFKPDRVDFMSVEKIATELFTNRSGFNIWSNELARLLYNQTMHPKIKGGEFYVCYFKDVMVDGELVDALGLFKTENKETFLKTVPIGDQLTVNAESGININKLDKGCLIFNTEQQTGYKIAIIDTNTKVAEIALYWIEDFLKATLKPGQYYHTKNFIDIARGFCEEILTEANGVSPEDKNRLLNEAVAHFKNKDKFNATEFEREVLKEPSVIEAFKDYQADFAKRMNVAVADEFDVSGTAVKKNAKYMRTVVKLDMNFHIYIHARHDYVEKGYDEEKGLKYYKLYYVNED